MKVVSNDFRNALRGIRELSAIVSYRSESGKLIVATQNDILLTTENGLFLTTEDGEIVVEKNSIISVNPLYNAEILKTICKSVEVVSKQDIPQYTWINVKIGVLVNGEYEYIDYGKYYTYDKPEYIAEDGTYKVIGYDKMLETMVDYDSNPLDIQYPITHKYIVNAICEKLNIDRNLINYPNFNEVINEDLYYGLGLTYRDILDDLCGATGGCFEINENNQFAFINPTETNEIVTAEDMKDTNVNIGEKHGPINAIVLTNDDVVLNYIEDTESIETYGKTELTIKNNIMLNANYQTILNRLFEQLNGLEYYTYDIDTTGLLIFEPLDKFNIELNGATYPCIMLNDDIKLTQGLTETIYAEEQKETTEEYTSNTPTQESLKDAVISINKANAEIKLSVKKDNVISAINLSSEEASIQAEKISLEGYTTINDGFAVDTYGNMYCNEAEMSDCILTGGNFYLQDSGTARPAFVIEGKGKSGAASYGKPEVHFNLNGATLRFNYTSADVKDYFKDGIENLIETKNNKIYANKYTDVYETHYEIKDSYSDTMILEIVTDETGATTIETNLSQLELASDYGTIKRISDNQLVNKITMEYYYPNTMTITSDGFATAQIGTSTGTHNYNNLYNYLYMQHLSSNGRSLLEVNQRNSAGVNDTMKFEVNGNVVMKASSSGLQTTTLTQTSLEENKKNFEKFEGALEIIKDIDLYKYNLKNEEDSHKKHIGFVIGEKYNYSKEITSIDENGKEIGVDNYSMTSLCLQAIKEQQKIIEQLQNKIKELESDK